MAIQKIKLEGFKNVPNMEVNLNGKHILLLGDNTVGKSNFIGAIKATFAGHLGKHSIKEGEKKAEVVIDVADYENEQPIEGTNYTFTMKIRKTKQGDEVAEFNVTMPSGEEKMGKTVIGKIVGEVELDQDFVKLSNTTEGKRKQLAVVESYMDEEVKQFLRIEKSKIERLYNERSEINREVKSLEGFIAESGIAPSDYNNYKTTINTQELEVKLKKGSEINGKIESVKAGLIEREAKLIKMKEEIAILEKNVVDGKLWLEENKPVEIDSVQEEIRSANEHNMKVAKVQTYEGKMKQLGEMKERAENFNIQYNAAKQAVEDCIRDLQLPVDGLSFDEQGNVYYKGKLVHEDNLSTAEQMCLNIDLLMAKHNKVGVILIERGESIGSEFLKALLAEADKRNMEVIMEQVERGTKELKIEVMPNYKNK